MNKLILIFLAVAMSLTLVPNAYAENNKSFYVSNAYFKGDGKYDVVVHDPNKRKLRIYVDDKNPTTTKTNDKGWATFRGVKMSGQSKLSFTERVNFKYRPIKYVKFVDVNGKQVNLLATGPKYSYDEFYKWLTGERYDSMNGAAGSARQQIISICGNADRSFGNRWVACMQEKYKDYLKPDTFVNNGWQGDYTTMMGLINQAENEKINYGSQSETDEYKKLSKEARKIYDRLAVTR